MIQSRPRIAAILGCAALLCGAGQAPANPFAAGRDVHLGGALEAVLERTDHSVVLVVSRRLLSPAPDASALPQRRTTLWSSGVVVDRDGAILTCADAAQPDDSLLVLTMDGARFAARFGAQEVKPGVSLIRVDDTRSLVPISASPGADDLQTGDWMLVLGVTPDLRPDFRLSRLETPGSSAEGRSARAYRLSSAASAGTCGGLVLDGAGNCRGVAINVEVSQEDGPLNGGCPRRASEILDSGSIAAISLEEAKALYARLREQESLRAGFLGLLVEADQTPAAANSGESNRNAALPLRVAGVLPGSPAERAGLEMGDRILSLDGTPVSEVMQVTTLIQKARPGDVVRLEVQRANAPLSLTVAIGDRSSLDWMERQQRMSLSWNKRLRVSLAYQQQLLQELDQRTSRYR